MADFTVRQGDNFVITDTLEDAAGNPVSIQAATVKLNVLALDGTPLLNAVTALNLQNGDGSDGTKGKVSYSGGGTTTATPGVYLASWTVLFGGTAPQTFPNGTYLLFEITADAPIGATTMFATSVDFAARLGLDLTADEHIRAAKLLADASGIIQDKSKQNIALVTDEVYTRPGSYEDRVRLPERPVVDVTSVILNGVALGIGQDASSGESVYLDGDELVRLNWSSVMQDSSFGLPWSGFGFPWWDLQVTYSHGFAAIPRIVKTVCLEMVVRAWVNPGSVARETDGNVSVVYDNNRFSPSGLLMNDQEEADIKKALRRHSGTIALR